jgi:hypothetical protein
MRKTFVKLWRSIASALVVLVAANACGDGKITGGDDTPAVVAGLRFSVQPTGSGTAGTTFSVSVELLNSAGTKISNATNAVTLTANGGADLLGTLTQSAVGGVATFSGLSVTKAGTGFSISASANGVTATSSSFTVAPAAANAGQSSATYTPSTVTTGATIAVVFTFKDQFGNPLPNKTVTLSSNLAGVTFTPSTGTTSATGTFTTNMVATAAGSATVSATVDGVAISLPTAVTITAPVTFTITTSSNPTTAGTTSGGGTFTQGASVTVLATPATGFTFTNWTEGTTAVSTSASFTFTATANRTLVANFTAAADPCTPLTLTFPGTVSGTVSAASGCTSGTAPAAVYRFTTAQGVATGHTFAITSTGFLDPVIEVTTDPPGTGNVGLFNTNGTVSAEWLLPAGTYRARVSSAAGSTGAFSLTGSTSSGISNNGSSCTSGVLLRVLVVGGTYTGQTLGAGDCFFTGGIFVDIFYIRSLKPCTITLAPTGFDALLQARNFALNATVGTAQNVGGVGATETLNLSACSTNGASIAIMASSVAGGETGSYVLTVTITGGGSLMDGNSGSLMDSNLEALTRPTVQTLGPLTVGDILRSVPKRDK